MSDEWYVCANQQVLGPYDHETVTNMIASGEIGDEVLLSLDRTAWVSVRDAQWEVGGAAPQTSLDALMQESPVAESPPLRSGGRDQIVILGQRSAGKTIYLSTLYAKCWGSLRGLTMSALSGQAHRAAMRVVTGLANGEWPMPTLDNRELALEVEYRGKKLVLVSMDYSGEVFRRAFVEDDTDSKEAKQLLEHLDNAVAVMLVVDPSLVYEHSGDIDAAIDDDFGMVQAAKRVRNWPGGEETPIVVVLTKMDLNRDLVAREGGAVSFLTRHWPALLRTLHEIPIFEISAVQTQGGRPGSGPDPNSKPINIEKPLAYCLRLLDEREQQEEMAAGAEAREARLRLEILQEKKGNRRVLIIGLSIAVAVAIILVVIFLVSILDS